MKPVLFDPALHAATMSRAALFQGVSLEAIKENLCACECSELQTGDVLLDPAKPNTFIHLILTGQLWVCLEPGASDPLLRLHSGDCVGEMSIVDSAVPSAYVLASEATQVLSVSNQTFWRMVEIQHVLAANLLKILARRIRDSNQVITESLHLQRLYRSKAETDKLTGLHNRTWFEEVFPKQLHLSERIQQEVSLLMIDIDHFKKVNDTYGHTCGDDALRHVADVLSKNVRATDLSARYGGEEMVVLMPATSALQAQEISDRLREAIANTPLPLSGGSVLQLRISGGIAKWRSGMTLVDLVKEADEALYRAKQAGRNRIMVSAMAATSSSA